MATYRPRSGEGFARTEHVQRNASDDRRQPAAEVLDLARVRAAEPKPGVPDGVVGLAERPQHADRRPPSTGALIFELAGEPVLLIHVTFLFLGGALP